eukprot:scaffold84216_cov52-Phaeocystis_antarctica.AAC.1
MRSAVDLNRRLKKKIVSNSDRGGSGVHTPSVHRQPTLRARGYGASRPVAASGRRFVVCGAAWGGAPPSWVPPGAEHRSTVFLLSPHWSHTRPTTYPVLLCAFEVYCINP